MNPGTRVKSLTIRGKACGTAGTVLKLTICERTGDILAQVRVEYPRKRYGHRVWVAVDKLLDVGAEVGHD